MNNKGLLILTGLAAGAVIYWVLKDKNAAGESYFNVIDTAYEIKDVIQDAASDLTGGYFMKVGNMKHVTAADVANKNVQAFLKVIRTGEGTADVNGYKRIFGGQLFTSFADHPRIVVKKSGYTSSAAGAYQFIVSTWDETKRIMGLVDFSPASQDLGAVGRIMARGALDDVKAGRFDLAIRKCAREWASLPYSPYGQPVITIAKATSVYTQNGGTIQQGITA